MFDNFMKQLRATSIVDWVLSLVLVMGIVAIAMYMCNHPDRDTTDSETFFPSFESNAPRTHYETFADADEPSADSTESAKKLDAADELDSVGDKDIGCCLVYYDRCGHCQTFKPIWERTCREANGRTINGKQIRMFETGNDVNESVWQEVSNRHGIQGYPTILVKIGGKDTKWREYNGPRNELGKHLMQ